MNQQIINAVLDFVNQRDWSKFHNPKDLAISISLEASELLEEFQWSGSDLYVESKRDKIKEELADVLIYCILMANAMDFDVNQIIIDKLKLNSEKYPVDKCFGNSKKYTEFGDVNDNIQK